MFPSHGNIESFLNLFASTIEMLKLLSLRKKVFLRDFCNVIHRLL